MSEAEQLRAMLRRSPVIPVLTVTRVEHAAPLAEALVAGGLSVLEVTLRSPVALDVITAMRRAVPDAIVGVGTLVRAEQFAQAADAGAQFGVSPGLTAALAAASATVPYPLLPGIMTPSELLAAKALGFSTCKLFPAQQAGGVGMLKALHAVFPGRRVLSDRRRQPAERCRVPGAAERAVRRRIVAGPARAAGRRRLARRCASWPRTRRG